MENFWSLLKRGINGTYISVEPFHLFRYVDEQAFRFNNRIEMNDSDRFVTVVKQIVGKRLTYEQLIGNKGEPETPVCQEAGPGEAAGLTFRFGPRLLGFIADFLRSASIRRLISECGTARTVFIAF